MLSCFLTCFVRLNDPSANSTNITRLTALKNASQRLAIPPQAEPPVDHRSTTPLKRGAGKQSAVSHRVRRGLLLAEGTPAAG